MPKSAAIVANATRAACPCYGKAESVELLHQSLPYLATQAEHSSLGSCAKVEDEGLSLPVEAKEKPRTGGTGLLGFLLGGTMTGEGKPRQRIESITSVEPKMLQIVYFLRFSVAS